MADVITLPTAPTLDGVSNRVTTHEAVCAERYGNLLSTINAMSARVGKLEGLVWVIAGTLIVGLAGLIVTLLLRLPTLSAAPH